MKDNNANFNSGKRPYSRDGGGRSNYNKSGDSRNFGKPGNSNGPRNYNKPNRFGDKPSYSSNNSINSNSYRGNNGGGYDRSGDRPNNNFGDRPRNNFGDKPRNNFGDRPRNNFGDRPRNNFDDKPRNNFGDKPRNNFGDRPRNNFGDRPRNNFGDRPRNNFGDKPRNNFGDKPRNNFGDRKPVERDKPAYKTPVEVLVSSVEQEDSGMVYGRNAVLELLKSGKSIDKLFVQSGQREGSITVIFSEAVKKSIPVIEVERTKLDSMINNSAHQGVIAMASEKEYCSIDDILNIAKEKNETPFILIADKIMDPHNLGAIIRTAECAGVHGIIIPKRHAAGISPIVTKTSAGASIHMAIAKVANIVNTLEELKEKGVWIVSSALENSESAEAKGYDGVDYDMPLALVVGNEGEGLSPLVVQKSDFLVKIPMFGNIDSLNVSCASAVLMYEVSRQRKNKQK